MVLYVLRERRRRRSRGVALGDGPFGKETGSVSPIPLVSPPESL